MSDETPTTGCLAGHCDITGKRSGVHHNGGCNCLRDLDHETRRAVRRELARLRAEVQAQHERIVAIDMELDRYQNAVAPRLRAEVERLTEQGKQDAAIIGGLAGDVERLTRERDEDLERELGGDWLAAMSAEGGAEG